MSFVVPLVFGVAAAQDVFLQKGDWFSDGSSPCQIFPGWGCDGQKVLGGPHKNVLKADSCCALCTSNSECSFWNWDSAAKTCSLQRDCDEGGFSLTATSGQLVEDYCATSDVKCVEGCSCGFQNCATEIYACMHDDGCYNTQDGALSCECNDTSCLNHWAGTADAAFGSGSDLALEAATCINKRCNPAYPNLQCTDYSKSKWQCTCIVERCIDNIRDCLGDSVCNASMDCIMNCHGDSADFCQRDCASVSGSAIASDLAECAYKEYCTNPISPR